MYQSKSEGYMEESKGFKTHLKALIIKQASQTGDILTQRAIQKATGISQPTLSRWYQGTIDRLDYDTVRKLMDFFGCGFNELVSVEDQRDKAQN
jgi:DNA-binding Xre family transcriptional regulator